MKHNRLLFSPQNIPRAQRLSQAISPRMSKIPTKTKANKEVRSNINKMQKQTTKLKNQKSPSSSKMMLQKQLLLSKLSKNQQAQQQEQSCKQNSQGIKQGRKGQKTDYLTDTQNESVVVISNQDSLKTEYQKTQATLKTQSQKSTPYFQIQQQKKNQIITHFISPRKRNIVRSTSKLNLLKSPKNLKNLACQDEKNLLNNIFSLSYKPDIKNFRSSNDAFTRQSISERVKFHFSILKALPYFLAESSFFDKDTQQWQQLYFLVFKKYLIERQKAVKFLKRYPMKNPFNFSLAEIPTKNIIQFSYQDSYQTQLSKYTEQNKAIENHLRKLYQKLTIKSHSQYLSMDLEDNFSEYLYNQLWAYLVLIQHNSQENTNIDLRIARVLQVGFLIAETLGSYLSSFEEAERAIQSGNMDFYISHQRLVYQNSLFQL